MMASESTARRLSPAQLAALRYAADPFPNLVAAGEYPGEVTADQLASAVRDVLGRYPALSAVVEPGWDGSPVWSMGRDLGAGPEVADLRDVADPATAVEIRLAELAATDLDPTSAPALRVAALQMADNRVRLVVVAAPVLLDSAALCWLVDVLGAHVTAASVPPDPWSWRQPLARAAAADVSRSSCPASADRAVPQAGFWATRAGDDGTRAPGRRVVRLDAALVIGLTALAQRTDSELDHVLIAAYTAAVSALTDSTSAVVVIERLGPRPPVGCATVQQTVAVEADLPSWADRVVAARAALDRADDQLGDEPADATCVLTGRSGPGSVSPTGTAALERVPASGVLRTEFALDAAGALVVTMHTRELSAAQLDEFVRVQSELLGLAADGVDPAGFDPLTAGQRAAVLADSAGPTRDWDLDACVHDLIAAQADRTPDAVAVTDTTTTFTYRELMSAAGRVALQLSAVGVGIGDVVGVFVARGAHLLVGYLGVLLSGAAYLPLDPAHPTDRIEYMLNDTASRVVLTDVENAGAVPAGPWRLLDVAQDEPGPGPRIHVRSSDLAYVIYTSGSTGRPKGVEVPHRGLVNYLRWAVEAYAHRGDGGAPIFSSPAFDMIVPNLYVPLLLGQRVLVLRESLSVFEIADALIAASPFSFIKLTPGQLGLLSELIDPVAAGRLAATLVVGADAFTRTVWQAWRRVETRTPLLNEYGPTEASVGNCVDDVTGDPLRDLVPIGRPIPNTSMYVLDRRDRLAPVGVPGELYIGGVCVVRGYHNLPDVTADRFVSDPLAAAGPGWHRSGESARMYRTGDIGRWLADGRLEFLGRVDDQVKIRGFRVEPAEVEAVLLTHPNVVRAVVTVVGDSRDTWSLAAYAVFAGGDAARLDVRGYLAERLPDYMVPVYVTAIDEIPLTSNGKVDRRALPSPTRPRADDRRADAPWVAEWLLAAGAAAGRSPRAADRIALAVRLASRHDLPLADTLGTCLHAADAAAFAAGMARWAEPPRVVP